MLPPPPLYPFGFPAWWQNLLSGLWVAAIILAGTYLLLSVLQIRKAANNNIPGQADEATARAVRAGTALGGLVGFGSVVVAVVAILS